MTDTTTWHCTSCGKPHATPRDPTRCETCALSWKDETAELEACLAQARIDIAKVEAERDEARADARVLMSERFGDLYDELLSLRKGLK